MVFVGVAGESGEAREEVSASSDGQFVEDSSDVNVDGETGIDGGTAGQRSHPGRSIRWRVVILFLANRPRDMTGSLGGLLSWAAFSKTVAMVGRASSQVKS